MLFEKILVHQETYCISYWVPSQVIDGKWVIPVESMLYYIYVVKLGHGSSSSVTCGFQIVGWDRTGSSWFCFLGIRDVFRIRNVLLAQKSGGSICNTLKGQHITICCLNIM